MNHLLYSTSIRAAAHHMMYAFLLCILICCCTEKTAAQEILDSKGREFWVTFLPNFHDNDSDDSLHIFLTSEQPTQGMIRWSDINGNTFSQAFQIAQANEIYHFQVVSALHELVGSNTSGVGMPTSQNEQEALQVFHITAEDEVTVYGLSQAMFSSDAFLALPQDVLGTEYIVLTYNSDGLVSTNQRTPSQFAVVATEDNTTVTITPSVATQSGGTATRTIRLDRGIAYLVQANVNNGNLTSDLTGSIVESDKPVAVFAGHQRATIPVDIDDLTSRDHLVEQLMPVSTWGRSAFVIPYIPGQNEAPEGTDLYRVLAAFDGTQVSIDGVLEATLNRGEFIQRPLTAAHHITATGQILVAEYKKTSGNQPSGVNLDQVSDPFMMLIPPSEQFLSSYAFVNAQGIQRDFDGTRILSYTLQYITVVLPDSYQSTVTIDGVPRTDLAFSPISATGYSYAHVQMGDGSHTITADTTFGLYVYGYGPANSYGYIGGLQLQILAKDGIPPRILSTDSCYNVFGMIYDTLSTDSRISTVAAPVDLWINTTVSIAPFTPYADSVGFQASLVNIYDDGEFTMTAIDSAGQQSKKEFLIPGFTVHVDSMYTDRVVIQQATFATGKSLCTTLTLINYGRAAQTIDTMLFRNGSQQFSFQPPVSFPFALAPGASRNITVCYISEEEGIIDDTLVIVDKCTPRNIVAFQYNAREDRTAPDLAMSIDACQTTARLFFTDSLLTDQGIETVRVLETSNCTVDTDTADLPRMMSLRVSVTDPDFDAIFTVEATDYRGNTRYFRDTIQGYTLQFVPAERTGMIYRDESRRLIHCDSVMLYNYGLLPFAVTEAYLAQNMRFSAPLSQFPVVIPPGDSAGVLVCFNPREQELYHDTLVIPRYCRSISLPLQGLGVPREILTLGDPHCGVSVVVSSDPPADIAPMLYPNPAADGTTIRFGVRTASPVTLRISSLGGTTVSSSSAAFDPGIYEMALNIAQLESGVYFCEVIIGTRRTVLPLHIIH